MTPSLRKTNLVVVSGAGNLPLSEGFESATFPPSGWSLNNAGCCYYLDPHDFGQRFWNSTASAYVNNYNYNAAGQKDWIITPSWYQCSSSESIEYAIHLTINPDITTH